MTTEQTRLVPEEMVSMFIRATDELGDMPIQESWASQWAKRAGEIITDNNYFRAPAMDSVRLEHRPRPVCRMLTESELQEVWSSTYDLKVGADRLIRKFAEVHGLAISAGPPEGLPYGILDPDYARVFTQARIVAWQYGYSCVMHGSFTRDLDLLLVPWETTAKPNHDQLAKLIALAGGLRFRGGKGVLQSVVDWDDRPHGRKSTSLHFPSPSDHRWVDLSVMPTLGGN